jgi:Na+-driven multidrug efflux pump
MAAAYVVITVRMVRRHTASPWPHWAGIRSAGTAAVPLFVRTLALRVYLLVATWLAARSGTTAVAAHTLASQVWNLLALLLDALAIAAQAIVARALGASELAAVRAVLRRLLRWALALGVLGGAAVLVAAPVIGPLFTGDGRVRATLTSLLVIVALFQPVNAVVFLWDGVLIGAGDGPYLAVAGILTTIGFLVAAAVSAALGGGVVGLWWAIGVYMLARLLALGARIRAPSWLVTGPASRTRPARDTH